ncbi:glycyl-radical enzyme activating protein [Synergistes jonesii]|uniref:Pyruvate formate lyase-activating protein n=1 Tax=Synergistes jonesii TaxID=2754 RepID=A0A073IR05_9BACT|nr:glycyl-radical enzyme activating protein [Synergistes jonesii]KEJ91906.1 hypothetical protein EH55_05845 [Synergistes jonesii]OFB61860.1 hypothetical protein JS72_09125 [Synergistes jonesii]OFB62189.1 hypothetical protein JS73_07950 [Synergistes jonesii]OFB62917.1 hypothetical protein JS79_08415 [Synergistes jonesii]OFB67423.1 hypothetical protein JS78_07955 [Synergistes jonesii]
MAVKGRILRIERSSNKDGHGLRTVVFFKGCPLSCEWCSTPESQSVYFEVGFVRSLCRFCRQCESVCPEGQILCDAERGTISSGGGCSGCRRCVQICQHDAVRLYGRDFSSDELVEEIARDDIFFHHGGGVTLSGGEVLMQPEFALAVLKGSADLGIDRTIETCAFAEWRTIRPLLDYLPNIFIDLKMMDAQKHLRYTGAENKIILENIRKIDAAGTTNITLRVPFVPTVNDNVENYEAMAEFCSGLKNLSVVEVLPYHRLGIETYKNLGRPVPFPELTPPSRSDMENKIYPLEKLNGVQLKIAY